MSGLATPLKWLVNYLSGSDSESSSMSAERAITYAPVWHAISKITGHVAQLPLSVHKATGRSNKTAYDHPGHVLVKDRPNGYQTPFTFREQITCHSLLWGNGRAYIHYDNGVPVELIPLMPDRTVTGMIEGDKWHATKPSRDDRLDLLSDMRENSEETILLHDSQVLHIPGLGFDGVVGKSLIKIASQSWGLGSDAERRSGSQMRKGYSGGLMLEAPPGLLREESKANEFLSWFRQHHDGEENAGKTGLLREGVKAQILQMSNSDAQFIEQRRFQRQETALWFCLEQILGDDSSVSYNSLEQKNLSYLSSCLMRWLCKWEQECDAKLLSSKERRRGYYFKFNVAALLRSDYKTTVESLGIAITHRIISPNEAREKLDMNPYEGGDEFENPAITPGHSSGNGEVDGDEEDDATEDTQQAVNAMAAEQMVRSLLSREANDVINGTNKRNFVGWIEAYYPKWELKLADKLESIGVDRNKASEHCQRSVEMLLSEAGLSTKENLKQNVEKLVRQWSNRVVSILESKDEGE